MGRALFAFALFLAAALAGAATFFAMAPDIVERRLNRVETPAGVSSAARALHTPLFVADLHADTLLWKRPLLARNLRGHADAPRLREGGVRLQVFAAVTQLPREGRQPPDGVDGMSFLAAAQLQPPATWTSPLARARHQAARLNTYAARSDTLMVVRSRSDMATLAQAHERDTLLLGGLLALEGLHALEGEAAHLDVLFGDGYRVFGLHHFFDNALGGSLHGDQSAGLTDFGREMVAAIEARGGIIDVAHSSPAVVRDVLAQAGKPVILSHTGFRGACDSARNISDDLMRQIAAEGGLIGVGFWANAVCDPSPAGIARMIAYGVELVGADHVALGSDFDGAVTTRFDATGLPALTEALYDAGLDEATVRKVMGENVQRFFSAHLPEG